MGRPARLRQLERRPPFTRPTHTAGGATVDVKDVEYAALASAMRTGQDVGDVFDALHSRGQIQLYANEAERQAAVGEAFATERAVGDPAGVLIVADTVSR